MEALLNFYQHLPSKINPTIFAIGFLDLRWYSLSYILAFATLYMMVRYRLKTEDYFKEFTTKNIEDMIFYAIIGTIAGARIGYILFYDTHRLLTTPHLIFWPFDSKGNFTGLSGMSYHGGVIGIIISYLIFIKRYKFRGAKFLDLFTAVIPLGYTWGRLGNFMNGELYGRVTDAWYGMYFYRYYLVNGEIVKKEFPELRHPSQLYEAFTEGILLFIILWALRKKNWGDGSISALYLVGYGFFRFLVEFVRQPDEQFKGPGEDLGTVFYQFSMGQVLCFIMIAIGLSWFFYAKNKGRGRTAKN